VLIRWASLAGISSRDSFLKTIARRLRSIYDSLLHLQEIVMPQQSSRQSAIARQDNHQRVSASLKP
jgi:hypothetical protein